MLEIVVIDGGLGNNLFQLHYAWTLKHNDKIDCVLLHLAKSNRSAETQFLELASSKLGLAFTSGSYIPSPLRILIARFKRMLSEKKIFSTQRTKLTMTSFNSFRLHCGYWQSIPFFPEVKNQFDETIAALLIDGVCNKAILHVRGGDYHSRKNAQIYSRLGLGYYRRALSKIDSYIKLTEYEVVSNDILYTRELLLGENKNFQFWPGDSAVEDFSAISRHKVIVGSNSTFCWWAARIGVYKLQTDLIIGPKHWMKEEYRHRSHPDYVGPANRVVLLD